MDFRVPKCGLRDFVEVGGESGGPEETDSGLRGAGEAGIVLSLFLRASNALAPPMPLAEDEIGRVPWEPEARLGRKLLVVGLRAVFVGLSVFCRLDAALLSALELELKDVRWLAEDKLVFFRSVFNGRFSKRLVDALTVSSMALSSPLPLISTELIEARFLWAELVAVPTATPGAVRRVADDGNGRVGGLLSPVPGIDAEEEVSLEAVFDVPAGLRFVIVDNLFGGMPFLETGGCPVSSGLSCSRETSLALDEVSSLSDVPSGSDLESGSITVS